MSRLQFLDLIDFFVIAEAATGIMAEELQHTTDITMADSALHAPQAGFGEVELYPEFAMKTAVLGYRLCRNHPLLDGNKRVAYLSMREFVERNGRTWTAPPADMPGGDETVATMVAVASGTMPEPEFVIWVAARLGEAGHP